MLQQENPEDFVIATGRCETVRKFIEICAKYLGWDKGGNNAGIIWEGEGVNEIGKRFDTGEVVIKIDPRYFRPSEVEHLLGDPKKAFEKLGWRPSSTLEELIHEMIDFDKNEANREFLLKQKGFNVFGAMETPPNLNKNI